MDLSLFKNCWAFLIPEHFWISDAYYKRCSDDYIISACFQPFCALFFLMKSRLSSSVLIGSRSHSSSRNSQCLHHFFHLSASPIGSFFLISFPCPPVAHPLALPHSLARLCHWALPIPRQSLASAKRGVFLCSRCRLPWWFLSSFISFPAWQTHLSSTHWSISLYGI